MCIIRVLSTRVNVCVRVILLETGVEELVVMASPVCAACAAWCPDPAILLLLVVGPVAWCTCPGPVGVVLLLAVGMVPLVVIGTGAEVVPGALGVEVRVGVVIRLDVIGVVGVVRAAATLPLRRRLDIAPV